MILTLVQLFKKQEIGEISRVDWLDQLTYRHIEQLQNKNPKQTSEHYLFIEFPRFDFPIVFCDHEYPSSSIVDTSSIIDGTQGRTGQQMPPSGPMEGILPPSRGGLISVYDPEAAKDRNNPCEAKHTTMVRSQRHGISDRELKPNSRIRDQLYVSCACFRDVHKILIVD